MPANYQIGNLRGSLSLSSPDTEPNSPEFDGAMSRFYDLYDGDHPLSMPFSHTLSSQRVYSSPPNSTATPPLNNPFEFPNNDDVLSNDDWPLGFNTSMHSIGRVNLSRSEALNMQSPQMPRAIRGSPTYSGSSSPSREQNLFGPRAITNTRSNSPAYSDPNREYKNYLGGIATEQELVNLQQLLALSAAGSTSSAISNSNNVAVLNMLHKNPNLLNVLMNNLCIQQQQQQSWPGSPQSFDGGINGNGSEFRFGSSTNNGGSSSSNGSIHGGGGVSRSYYGGGNSISSHIASVNNSVYENNNNMALLEQAARYRRNAASKQVSKCSWEGEFPIRVNKNPIYSVKVFLGGVPWDITQETLEDTFMEFGRVAIQWPSVREQDYAKKEKENKGNKENQNSNQCKGYVYVIFESDKQVKALLAACKPDYSKGADVRFFSVSSKKLSSKCVQVIPWAISDSNYMRTSHMQLDPKRTVFVGALHGLMHAEFLYNVFDELFGGVMFAGIDTDKFKYPIGSARVMFNNSKSYLSAVHAEFVDLKTPRFTKTVQVDPYLEDSPCSVCLNQQGPYFCKVLTCFQYFCHNCWHYAHKPADMAYHKPLMRNSKTAPANASANGNNAATYAPHHLVAASNSATTYGGGLTATKSHHQHYQHWATAAQVGATTHYNTTNSNAGVANINNNNYLKYNRSCSINSSNNNANADAIRGSFD